MLWQVPDLLAMPSNLDMLDRTCMRGREDQNNMSYLVRHGTKYNDITKHSTFEAAVVKNDLLAQELRSIFITEYSLTQEKLT